MDLNNFLNEMGGEGRDFLGGILLIDIVGHSKFKGNESRKAQTKVALKNLIEPQLLSSRAAIFNWAGDGIGIVFDVSSDCDEMILFADRIRSLIPHFNRTRYLYNWLSNNQQIALRIIGHAGLIRNTINEGGALSGGVINHAAKSEKKLGKANYVVITEQVQRRLTKALADRLTRLETNRLLGDVYILDGSDGMGYVHKSKSDSSDLKEWIINTLEQDRYHTLLYFGYTNELLHSFLLYELRETNKDIKVKILARDWVVERIAEEKFNRELDKKGASEGPTRLWKKAGAIKTNAEETYEVSLRTGLIESRFYPDEPLFNGAILLAKNGKHKAFIGISKWQSSEVEAGSPYKLREWPALILDGQDHNQLHFISYLISRFDELWSRSLAFSDVSIKDERESADNPSTANSFWEARGSKFLLVMPGRSYPKRVKPVIAGEDAEAARQIEKFLNRYEAQAVESHVVNIPDNRAEDWYPKESLERIENWDGHVVYICNLSVPPTFWSYLQDRGFPHIISGAGGSTPEIHHTDEKGIRLGSPIDKKPSEPCDYSIIGKISYGESGKKIFIVSGLHAMGTLGAALHLTDIDKLLKLTLDGFREFGAIIQVNYDEENEQIIDTQEKLHPEPPKKEG